MEPLERTKMFNQNNIKFTSLFTNQKENIISNKECKYQNVNNYVKLENTQSFSTGTDDIKDNEIKYSLYEKSTKGNEILSNSSFLNEDNNSKKVIFQLSSQDKNSKEVKLSQYENKIFHKERGNKTEYNNSLTKFEKDTNNGNNLNNQKLKKDFEFEKNLNRKKDIKNNNENTKNFKEVINNNIIIKNKTLKSFPPKIPNLFDYKYNLSLDENNIFISDYYKKINGSIIPNIFYNHLIINNNKISKENSNYFSISTTNRIKGKLLTILYFCPIKNI